MNLVPGSVLFRKTSYSVDILYKDTQNVFYPTLNSCYRNVPVSEFSNINVDQNSIPGSIYQNKEHTFNTPNSSFCNVNNVTVPNLLQHTETPQFPDSINDLNNCDSPKSNANVVNVNHESQSNKCHFSVLSLNVCGLQSKLICPGFLELISKYNTIGLQETKLNDLDHVDVEGYEIHCKNRKTVRVRTVFLFFDLHMNIQKSKNKRFHTVLRIPFNQTKAQKQNSK